MTLAERDRRLARLEQLLEDDGSIDESFILMEIFRDKLWEVSDDSFEEFVHWEFTHLTPSEAVSIVRLCASFDENSERIVEGLISEPVEPIDYQI